MKKIHFIEKIKKICFILSFISADVWCKLAKLNKVNKTTRSFLCLCYDLLKK